MDCVFCKINKGEIPSYTIFEDDIVRVFMDVARDIKKLLEEKLNIDGVTLIQNNGDVQEVKHFHLHLKPYYNSKQELMDVKEVYNILCS